MLKTIDGGLTEDKPRRCGWVGSDEIYRDYHDNEWGVVEHDDSKLFELLILEGFQAGLSWLTILKKRENFRKAFFNWDIRKISRLSQKQTEKLMADEGIIRSRRKIDAAKKNALAFIEIQKEFGSFDRYIWGFTNGNMLVNRYSSWRDIPAKSSLSETISKDLKKRGFIYCGPVIVYSYLQAIGMIDDHMKGCFKA